MSFGTNAKRSLTGKELREAMEARNIDQGKYLSLLAAKQEIPPDDMTIEASLPYHTLVMCALDLSIEEFLDEICARAREQNVDVFKSSC